MLFIVYFINFMSCVECIVFDADDGKCDDDDDYCVVLPHPNSSWSQCSRFKNSLHSKDCFDEEGGVDDGDDDDSDDDGDSDGDDDDEEKQEE